jgi:hypothetical protein
MVGAAGLRALQGRRQLEQLVAAVKAQRDRMQWPAGPPPLLVKVAPDLTPDEMKVGAWRLVVTHLVRSRLDSGAWLTAGCHGCSARSLWCKARCKAIMRQCVRWKDFTSVQSDVRAMQDIAALTLRLGVDGLVVSNTTLSRPGTVAQHQHGSEVAAARPHMDIGCICTRKAANACSQHHCICPVSTVWETAPVSRRCNACVGRLAA